MVLKDILNEIVYVDETHEFKLMLNDADSFSWLKTIAGFANHIGGDFYIGVNDKDQKLVGFTLNEADKIRNKFNNEVNLHLSPQPIYTIEFLNYNIRDDVRYIILIHIFESEQKPITLKFKEAPMIFIRRQGFTSGAELEEIQDMVLKSHNDFSFDKNITKEKYKREDYNLLFEYYYRANNSVLTEKKLISIGFMDSNYMLSNAGLLFRDNYNEHPMLQLCNFAGLNSGNDITDKVEYNCNILECIEKALNYIDLRSNHSIYKTDHGRVYIDSYPKQSIIEGVVNAFAHRDYYINSLVKIDMFSNRLEILSPGKLFRYSGEITRRYDLTNIIPTSRNPIIINILIMLKLMESAGTGFNKIEQDYKNQNTAHKPFINYSTNEFMLVLPNLTDEVGVSMAKHNMIIYPSMEKRSIYDEEIVNMCYKRELQAREIAKELNISYSSYLINEILQNLVDNKILLKTKKGNTNHYITNEEIITLI